MDIKRFVPLGIAVLIMAVAVAAVAVGDDSELMPELVAETPSPEGFENPRWFSDSMRWLTAAEKAKAIEIALDTPEALWQLESESVYSTKLEWLARASLGLPAWWVLEYETVETGIPAYVPQSVVVYPCVFLYFGDPQHWIIMVAVDLEAEDVVLIDEYPARGEFDFPPDG
ncbi:MAG: hypothetical protein PVJ61_07805 [Dehalococcoidia bacterium]|jgi:hypothetical protein